MSVVFSGLERSVWPTCHTHLEYHICIYCTASYIRYLERTKEKCIQREQKPINLHVIIAHEQTGKQGENKV